MRFALAIEYCGTRYVGWQAQDKKLSIQATLAKALSEIASHPVEVFTAGRTDKGVHASEQIVHFDTTSIRPEKAWVVGTNTLLPHDIRVLWAKAVPETFHARHRGIARRYRYFIYVSKVSPAFGLEQITWIHTPLNVERMQEAASHLIGKHDFTSFRSSLCQSKTPVRTMIHLDVTAVNGDGGEGSLIMLDIKANAFLHHMVRNIAGLLMMVGQGKMEPIQAKYILEAKDRTKAPKKASANGLYLVKVHYGDDYGFKDLKIGPRFLTSTV